MPANPEDLAALTRKLRGKGLDDAAVTQGLTGLGYSKTQAASAVGGRSPVVPPAPAAEPSGSPTPPGAQGAPNGVPATGAPPKAKAAGQPKRSGIPAKPSALSSPFSLSGTAKGVDSITLTPPRKLSGRDAGGFVVGLFLYVLATQYVRHGPEGVKGWLGAKFLNKTWAPPTTTAKGRRSRDDKVTDQLGGQSPVSGDLNTTRPRPHTAEV